MAGSRLEKIGTIYKRVQGLLRSGALKEVDKPLWYDVYEAFPPRDSPLYERPVPKQKVLQILYPEDIIRARFYKIYGNPDVVDISNERVKTTCERFVDKYIELLQTDSPRDSLFEATANALKEEGLRLRTVEEVDETTVQTVAAKHPEPPKHHQKLSVTDIFGEKTVKLGDVEEKDYIIEDDDKIPKL